MLEIRKNRFAKPYENDFFRILAAKLVDIFEELKIDGVLIGSPICTKADDLQLDTLLVTETAVVIIDFKNYGGNLNLPSENNFKHKEWILQPNKNHDRTIVVKGGAGNKNPFLQIDNQRNKLNSILSDYISPQLQSNVNIETKDTRSVICFHQPVEIIGSIPNHLKHAFYIADSRNIVDKIRDIIDVAPNEWKGEIKGNKLDLNVFNEIKKLFLSDSFNPLTDNDLFSEFDKIDYQETETNTKIELIEMEFEKIKPLIKDFVFGDTPILLVNADLSAYRIEIAEKIVSHYLTSNGDDSMDSKVCFLAPNNRHVADLVRLGAPIHTKSLYAKLFDFEHSTVELISNSLNEKEVFPLLENEEPIETLYVIFNSHLIYDFTPKADELIKFGSGSLCNDTLLYLDIKKRNNKILFINDPFFYGFREKTIVNTSVLESHFLNYSEVQLIPRAINTNTKSIKGLIENLKSDQFKHFNFDNNQNIDSLRSNKFKTQLEKLSTQNLINNITILTREKSDNKGINNWIRKNKGVNNENIHVGDVFWIENRVTVPEEVDPFSIPKFVLSGDVGEVLEVYEQYSFSSSKYNFKPIEVTKCKVQLRDYESVKDLYISTSSTDALPNLKELKNHIQIRCREIIDQYLITINIEIKDVFIPVEFKKYEQQKSQIVSSVTEGELDNELKKLDAKWKINKRKERYAKMALLRDINSEYFKISQLVYFKFGWAICLKSSYGYNFKETYLVEYKKAHETIERYHQFLYSAVGCSNKLTIHNFCNINPWFSLEIDKIRVESIPGFLIKSPILVQINSIDFDGKDKFLSEKFNLQNHPPQIVSLCRWVHDKIEGKTNFVLQNIIHSAYLEKYVFSNGNENVVVQLSYTGKWEIKSLKSNIDSEVLSSLVEMTDETNKKPFLFIQKENWQIEELAKLQDSLLSKGAFIYQISPADWKYEIKISSEEDECVSQLFYTKDGFFSNIQISNSSGTHSPSIFLNSVNEIKSL